MRLLVIGIVLALSACGGDAPTISVEKAVESRPDGPVRVRGYVVLVKSAPPPRMCEALAESHPPQCGGPSLSLELAPNVTLTLSNEAGDVAWTDEPVTLLGELDGETLRVSATDG